MPTQDELTAVASRLSKLERAIHEVLGLCSRLESRLDRVIESQQKIEANQDSGSRDVELLVKRQAELAEIFLRTLEDFAEHLGFSLDADPSRESASALFPVKRERA